MRETNIIDFEKYRRSFSNPLFNGTARLEFNNAFQESEVTDDYILEHFYVDERENNEVTNASILSLLTAQPREIRRAGDIDRQIKKYPGRVYLLIGKKGIGKTILLKYFRESLKKLTNQEITCPVVVYLDLKNKRKEAQFINSLPDSMLVEIFGYLKREVKWACEYITNPAKIRKLDESYAYVKDDDLLIKRVLDHPQEIVEAFLNWAKEHGHEVTIIVDNIDDYKVADIRVILNKCRELKNKFSVRCVVALRDCHHPKGLGIDDSNISSSHICLPNIYLIVKRRLQSIDTSRIKGLKIKYGEHEVVLLSATDIIECFDDIVKEFIESLSSHLYQELYELVNYNTREYLLNIFHFFHSPYLFSRPNFIGALVRKIKESDPGTKIERPRRVQLFDFIECFMAIHSLCYDEESRIFNMFHHEWGEQSDYSYHNSLIYIRILQILPRSRARKYKCQAVVDQLRSIGYKEDCLMDAMDKLLKEALVESADGVDITDVQEISLSAKGRMYIQRLIYEYSYLLFISDAVPMENRFKIPVERKFGKEAIPLSRGNLELKIQSVQNFIKFIKEEEQEEAAACGGRLEPVLRRIRGNMYTAAEIKERVNIIISRMLRYDVRRVKPIQSVEVIEEE